MTPQDALARIRRYDPRLKSFVHLIDPPMGGDGPVFAVKDLIDVAGRPTGGGGRIPLTPSAERHAAAVQRLLDAGWCAIGKTHTVELAYGGWGANRAVGAPWNPWDAKVHRAPGGSSSGSAVAVAAGFCDLALGTDTGGSVRIPAAACGVVGLKPGRGLTPLDGVHPLSPALDTLGTLARTVATAATGLAIIAGPGRFDAGAALTRDVRGLRVAALSLESLGEVQPDVAALYRQALERLAAASVVVETVQPPWSPDDFFLPNGTVMAGEGWRIRSERIAAHRDEMDPWVARRFEAGAGIDDAALDAAYARRAEDQARVHAWLSAYDGLVCPTAPITAPPLEAADETISPFSRFTRAANYLDLPAASVPCGLGADAMPVGFQIMGRPRDEAGVVAIAAAFERVSGWNGRQPDLAGFES